MEILDNCSHIQGEGRVTYEEVKSLFSKYPVASTWNSANPQALHFDTGPKSNWKSRDLHAPNRGERYVKVPFAEVASHIEKTGRSNSENIFYRLRPMTSGTAPPPKYSPPPPPPPPPPRPKANSPLTTRAQALQLFGLTEGASTAEITAEYYRLAQQCHPDKVAGLAPEFQALADAKMKELNAAYKLLKP